MKPFFTFSLFFLLACNNGSEKSTATKSVPLMQEEDTTATIDWAGTDMMEFIHYPEPANQRVYRHVMIKDTSLVGTIIQNLQQSPVNVKECTQNYKFYLFRKGEVYKTVYVSDSCHYLAYAINSNQHFVALSNSTKTKIDSLVRRLKD